MDEWMYILIHIEKIHIHCFTSCETLTGTSSPVGPLMRIKASPSTHKQTLCHQPICPTNTYINLFPF